MLTRPQTRNDRRRANPAAGWRRSAGSDVESATEARQTVEQLRFQASLLDAVDQAVIAADLEGRVIHWNRFAEMLYGWPASDALGKSARDLVFPQLSEAEAADIRARLQNGESWAGELGARRKDGSVFPAQVSGSPIFDSEGRRIATVYVSTDITERRALEESRARLAAIVESTEDAIVGEDLDGLITSWNGAAERLYGYSSQEAIGQPIQMLIPSDRLHERTLILETVQTGERVQPFDTVHLTRDGRQIDVSANVFPVKARSGVVVGASAIFRDIGARQPVEEALRASERRYRELADSLPQPVFEADEELRVTFINRAAVEAFGFDSEDLAKGLNVIQGIAPKDWVRARENIEWVFGDEKPSWQQYECVRKDGSTFPTVIYASRIVRDGKVRGLRGVIVDITEREAAERELRETREFLANLLDNASAAIYVDTEDGRVRLANRAWEEVTGIPRESAVGRRIDELFPRETADRLLELNRQVLETETAIDAEHIADLPDGRRYYQIVKYPLRDETGRTSFVGGITIDVTERSLAKEALRESQQQLRQILEQMPYPVEVCDRDGTTTLANPAFLEMYGIPSADLVVGRYNVFEDPAVQEMGLLDEIRAAFDGQTVFRPEVALPLAAISEKHRAEKAGVVHHEITMFPVRDFDGHVSQVVTIWKDIGDRKRAEALSAREAEVDAHLAALSSALLSATTIDEISSLVLAEAEQLTRSPIGYVGYVDPVTGRLVCPTMSKEPWTQRRMAEGDVVFERLDGLAGWAIRHRESLLTNSPKADPRSNGVPEWHVPIERFLAAPALVNGALVGQVAVANSERDYTEWDLRLIERLAALYALVVQRRRAEEALGESEERFRRLAENAQDVIYRIELRPRPHFTYVSPSAESVFGCTPDELYADLDLLLRLTRDEDRASLQSAFCGKTIAPAVTVRLRRPDGQTVWIESRQVPIHDDTNYVVAFEGIARDITRQKRLEDELVRAQRLEMAGQIAGQVAHDLNNLLAPLVGYPELMKMQLPDDDPLQDLCDTMIEAGQQIGGISANLLALGRRGLLNQQPIDLNRLVRQSVAQLRAAPETFRVAVDLAEPLRPVSASAPQILRVVTNLVVNAREAMSDRGTLAIRTSNVVLTEAVGAEAVGTGAVGQCARVAPGEYVLLEVEDSGCGIPPELKCKVFEPFFTTKTGARRRGSGLGLSIVNSIVSDHHGYVDLESTVGKGTTFRIYLPACQERLEEVRAKAVKSGSEAILVVDDDPIQRDVLARLLCRLGYQVASAESGEEAVAFLRERRADLVVLDMVMDGIDGTETYRQALEVQADLRAIVISGLAEPERVREATEIGVGAFLLKPVAGERLARAVRDELDRGARTASTTGRVTLSEAGGQAALSGHTPAV